MWKWIVGITLTLEEKKAIDWVGHRDWNGNDLKDILFHDDVEWYYIGKLHKTRECSDFIWNNMLENTFHIPEHLAWEILASYIAGGEMIPHFAPELEAKIQTLLDSII